MHQGSRCSRATALIFVRCASLSAAARQTATETRRTEPSVGEHVLAHRKKRRRTGADQPLVEVLPAEVGSLGALVLVEDAEDGVMACEIACELHGAELGA